MSINQSYKYGMMQCDGDDFLGHPPPSPPNIKKKT